MSNNLAYLFRKNIFAEGVSEYRDSSLMTDYEVNNCAKWLEQQLQEPHRKYHNAQHIYTLQNDIPIPGLYVDSIYFNTVRTLFNFFHDCIYHINTSDVEYVDNEHQSASIAQIKMAYMGFHKGITKVVVEAIQLSKHIDEAHNPLIQILLDSDCAILGSKRSKYIQYVTDIREEYSMVPEDVWQEKRNEFLAFMLAKPHIYQHPFYQSIYEKAARANITCELANIL